MPYTSEEGLTRGIVKAIRKHHATAWVFHPVGGPYQLPGVPDLLCCVEGRFVGCEVKFPRPGETSERARNRATPQQLNQIRLIRKAGGVADVVVSVDEALALIEDALSVVAPRMD